jgi:hypothetical protein
MGLGIVEWSLKRRKVVVLADLRGRVKTVGNLTSPSGKDVRSTCKCDYFQIVLISSSPV